MTPYFSFEFVVHPLAWGIGAGQIEDGESATAGLTLGPFTLTISVGSMDLD